MGKGFWGRYYEGYTEESLPGDDGKFHTVRTYRDYWYVPELSARQRIARAAAYWALYLGSAAAFSLGAVRPERMNSSWYGGLLTGAVLILLIAGLIPLAGCTFGKERQTVYEYRSGSKTCILCTRTAAVLMAAAGVLALISAPLQGEGFSIAGAYFVLGGVCQSVVWLAERRVIYSRQTNENAYGGGSNGH